jgi:fructosamine-3-kinase
VTDRFALLVAALTTAAGHPVEIHRRHRLAGGSINETERLDTSAGSFVLKANDAAPPDFFDAEADGLRALSRSGTSLDIPDVIAVSPGPWPFIVLRDLGDGDRPPDFDARLGRGLAAIHRHRGPAFGFTRDNYCGLTPQPNPWTDSWVEFYRTSRLGCQLRSARDAGRLSAAEASALDDLIARLDRWIDEPDDGPSLTHGDLWSGNVHVTNAGQPALIDPAVYYGHREADLGMMTLFGGFSPRVFAAYDESYPLESGWRERLGLYQLYHLLNHLNLFGEAYRTRTIAVARRYA